MGARLGAASCDETRKTRDGSRMDLGMDLARKTQDGAREANQRSYSDPLVSRLDRADRDCMPGWIANGSHVFEESQPGDQPGDPCE